MTLVTNQELADEMRCSVDTLAIRKKLLKLKATFDGYHGHRWSRPDADNFILRWSTYSQKNVKQSSKTVGARTGNAVLKKAKGNRRDGQRAGNRAGHQSADGKRQPAPDSTRG